MSARWRSTGKYSARKRAWASAGISSDLPVNANACNCAGRGRTNRASRSGSSLGCRPVAAPAPPHVANPWASAPMNVTLDRSTGTPSSCIAGVITSVSSAVRVMSSANAYGERLPRFFLVCTRSIPSVAASSSSATTGFAPPPPRMLRGDLAQPSAEHPLDLDHRDGWAPLRVAGLAHHPTRPPLGTPEPFTEHLNGAASTVRARQFPSDDGRC